METLESFLVSGIFAFMLIFVRIGTAITIMPGLGDSFVPRQVRLFLALGLSLVLAPVVQPFVPNPLPALAVIFSLILMEFVIGLFIGTVARILMTALDVAGMIISMTSGLANAQVFNPSLASQGSITGAFLSMTGVMLLFATNLHHMLIYGLVESYQMFPIGAVPDAGGMAQMITKAVSAAFLIGFQLAVPFVMVAMLLYIGMGVLSRLMPQVQVFILSLPIQIILSMITLFFVLSTMMLFWLTKFEEGMTFFLTSAG
ncbi:MAG: flagellar biosynthetic protein FliR [Alphaproteobacteria bacterium]|nr:flagellar biosynthetic protein FliR [Alphaproteobacteria bacterium]NCQ87606.1 flagellar biosynthetic protein FliR [Alphaproteobacteria bacterium]NCT05885.1 flagellar biosynthetic protein FliR [Alphaproteobacteria bacterium]